ncbi:MAG: ArnT family glycosyltransferase, partial [Ktedonobacterales bacterium]
DASAYLFSAKTFASGRLWVPTPAADRFPGAFMLDVHGMRFTQYPPGTGVMLAVGILLGAPWLVEPLLGTLALLGIGLIAARLYDRRVATIAVLLGVLSPFYSYIAASYLSHAVALFFLVWGFWLLLRFAQGGAGWNLPLAVAFFGMAQLTRDQVGLAAAGVMVAITIGLSWRRLLGLFIGREAGVDGQPSSHVSSLLDSPRLIAVVAALAVALLFAAANLAYNAALTGKATVSPRLLFNPGDHFGFGMGVGFYGQHTVAAGFVNLDELLTSLAIDLFGWPFYLTLAFIFVPFILRRAILADWLLLVGGMILTGAYIGYFYHGIYLGPRYLFETLPFLLILTARGIVELARVGVWARAAIFPLSSRGTTALAERVPPLPVGEEVRGWGQEPAREVSSSPPPLPPAVGRGDSGVASRRVSVATAALMAALLACALIYFWPRQIALRDNFTGLPAGTHIALDRIYAPGLHHAIIVTGDYTLYEYVLFPLNDPMLRQDVLYALAADASQYAELRAAYPGRALYQLNIAADGSVTYTPVAGG